MCLAKGGDTSVSLGFEQHHPRVDENGVVTLLYAKGAPCSDGSGVETKVEIHFACKPGTLVCVKIAFSVCGVVSASVSPRW